MSVKKEMEAVCSLLKSDAGYWQSWKANIAVQFQDEWQRVASDGGLPATREAIHEISNQAAENFLQMLTRQ